MVDYSRQEKYFKKNMKNAQRKDRIRYYKNRDRYLRTQKENRNLRLDKIWNEYFKD